MTSIHNIAKAGKYSTTQVDKYLSIEELQLGGVNVMELKAEGRRNSGKLQPPRRSARSRSRERSSRKEKSPPPPAQMQQKKSPGRKLSKNNQLMSDLRAIAPSFESRYDSSTHDDDDDTDRASAFSTGSGTDENQSLTTSSFCTDDDDDDDNTFTDKSDCRETNSDCSTNPRSELDNLNDDHSSGDSLSSGTNDNDNSADEDHDDTQTDTDCSHTDYSGSETDDNSSWKSSARRAPTRPLLDAANDKTNQYNKSEDDKKDALNNKFVRFSLSMVGNRFNSTPPAKESKGELIVFDKYCVASPSKLKEIKDIKAVVDNVKLASQENNNISNSADAIDGADTINHDTKENSFSDASPTQQSKRPSMKFGSIDKLTTTVPKRSPTQRIGHVVISQIDSNETPVTRNTNHYSPTRSAAIAAAFRNMPSILENKKATKKTPTKRNLATMPAYSFTTMIASPIAAASTGAKNNNNALSSTKKQYDSKSKKRMGKLKKFMGSLIH